jgi:hypothetical protein
MKFPNRSLAMTLLVAACWSLAALAAAYVLIAHRAHALEWLPFAFLLACPLMHGSHGHHQQSAEDSGRRLGR